MGMILTVWRVFLGFDFSTHSPLVEEKGESLPPSLFLSMLVMAGAA